SALTGDNVVRASSSLPWYAGNPLLEVLETAAIDDEAGFDGLRLPIQYVIRPDGEFRGYAGTVASGTVEVGDEVMLLPWRRRSRVKSILTPVGDAPSASVHQAVTGTLHDEIDVARGNVLVSPDNAPTVDSALDATISWMADEE